jgi:molybdate transport system substrate-binding protein
MNKFNNLRFFLDGAVAPLWQRPALLQGLALMLLVAASTSLPAAEIRVLSGGAAKALVAPLTDSFQRASGQRVQLAFEPMGTLVKMLASGSPPDLVIVTAEVLEGLVREGRLAAGSGRPIARVGVGVAVNEKAPLPDISTPEALRATLLAVRSLVYIDPTIGTSGKHVAEVLNRLGISEAVRGKTTLLKGGYVVEPVGRGEIELGIHQISEILPVKGIRLVGPLPEALQKYTVYVATPVPGTREPQLVAAYVQHLLGEQARAALAPLGYTRPE